MDRCKFDFLISILGEDGARALRKAADRNPEVEAVLVPRAILAWINLIGRGDYEGDLPGVGNTYLAFQKSEDAYTGSVTIGEDVYSFECASLLHLASAVAVAIGVDADRFDPTLRDLDLARLGKSIDLLAKAHSVAMKLAEEQDLMKAITAIPPGPEVRESGGARAFDYSHVLQPAHRRAGYSIHISHNPESGTVLAHLRHGRVEVGSVKGVHENGALHIEDAEIMDDHQGKGLGSSMYEALMAHAHHNGIGEVAGSIHSTMASRVHQKVAQKHGMGYKPVPTPSPALASPTPGPYDNRMGPYKYAIKAEEPANKTEAPGPAHAATPAGPPQPGQQPTMQTQKGPLKLPKKQIQMPGMAKPAKTLKVTKSQAEHRCKLCGFKQFKGERFSGCLCFRDLSKSVITTADAEGFTLEFKGTDWDAETLQTLLETLRSR